MFRPALVFSVPRIRRDASVAQILAGLAVSASAFSQVAQVDALLQVPPDEMRGAHNVALALLIMMAVTPFLEGLFAGWLARHRSLC